jgi:molybdopterin-guanine dinucleotide biosynthesis protein A
MVAGLLLTGGASTRMGVDKAALVVGGERLADRAARVLGAVCLPMIEVGRGYTGLETILEEPPGTGPLAALAAGGRALRHRDHPGPAIALAVDLPFVTADFLRFLATYPDQGTVVPFVAGEPQPVCARYSAEALLLAAEAVRSGERSIRAFLPAVPDLQWAGPRMWGHVADERTLADVDTPEDLRRFGLATDLEGGVEQ